MGIDQRRHPRYGVHLAVKYTNAEQFVTDYVENLSLALDLKIIALTLPTVMRGTGAY